MSSFAAMPLLPLTSTRRSTTAKAVISSTNSVQCNLPSLSAALCSSSPNPKPTRRSTTAKAVISSTNSVQCNLPSLSAALCSSSPNPKPTKSLQFLNFSAVSCILFHIAGPAVPFGNSVLNYGGGGGGEGGGGGNGGGEGGGFWRFFSPAAVAKDDEPQQEWDSHGLPANIVVQLNKLSGFKKYKVSDIIFFDRRRGSTVEDYFIEMVSLRPGGIYTKAQLQKELETLATCGIFLETKTNPDGTIKITIPFIEYTGQSDDRFNRCINVGLLLQSNPIEMDADKEKEKLNLYRSQVKDYRRRIERSRPCLLPSVRGEILQMLRDHGKVSAELLEKIRDMIQQCYHKNGYAPAEVVGGDKLGNIFEGDTQFPVIWRELPNQVAAELRIPKKSTYVYVYRRMGQGSLCRVGMKLGFVRVEYAVDINSGTGSIVFKFKLGK